MNRVKGIVFTCISALCCLSTVLAHDVKVEQAVDRKPRLIANTDHHSLLELIEILAQIKDSGLQTAMMEIARSGADLAGLFEMLEKRSSCEEYSLQIWSKKFGKICINVDQSVDKK